MKIIWNGFETEPHTLPKNCAICLGSFDGEFVRLPCSHGAPDRDPLHIRCVIEALNSGPGPLQSPRCPICRKAIDERTISRISGYVHRNKCVEFPDDDDVKQKKPVCETEQDQKILLMRTLVGAASSDEQSDLNTSSDEKIRQVLDHAEQFAEQIRPSLECHTYTLEDLIEKERELEKLEEDLSVYIGRGAQMERMGGGLFPEFRDALAPLLSVRQQIEDLEERIQQEKREIQEREETWNSGRERSITCISLASGSGFRFAHCFRRPTVSEAHCFGG